MNFDLIAPCPKCPFRTDVTPYLRTDRVIEICESLVEEDMSFSCHQTTQFDDDGEVVHSRKEQHCAGATIMLEKMDRPNQAMRIYERIGCYDRTKLRMTAPVYADATAMIAAYRKHNTKRR